MLAVMRLSSECKTSIRAWTIFIFRSRIHAWKGQYDMKMDSLLVFYFLTLTKFAQKWARNDQKWAILAFTVGKRSKLVKFYKKDQKMVNLAVSAAVWNRLCRFPDVSEIFENWKIFEILEFLIFKITNSKPLHFLNWEIFKNF